MTDNAGNVPGLGDYVAYNWSGNIATGFIEKLGKTHRNRPIYHIYQVLPNEGTKSVVRGGPTCVLVLEKKEE